MKNLKDQVISSQELLQMIKLHEKSKLNTDEKLWLNEDINYVDSVLTVEAVIEEASILDVIRATKDVTRLIVNEEVYLEVEADHFRIIAEKIIIIVDFWTSDLFKSSKIKFFKNFFIVVDVEMITMSLNKTKFSKLKFMSILVTECDLFYFVY